jgi:hypothetical protein
VARRIGGSIDASADNARAMASAGRYEDAARYYRELVGQTHVIDYEYDEWLRGLAEAYERTGRGKLAGYVHLYLHQPTRANAAFADGAAASLEMRARVAELDKAWQQAAALYREAGRPVHAAVALERAAAWDEAAAAWKALLDHGRLRGRDYEAALAHFNFGTVTARLDPRSAEARRALIETQHRLEAVADAFETAGELERAFDCYQILLKLGRDSGRFENLAEGYLNCIRVLREDNLKFYVLQYYEDFIKLALERDEFHAAATLYQEAADFAARAALPYDRRYQQLSARTWIRCAEEHQRQGAPLQLTENALLAAAGQFSAVGDLPAVGDAFRRLAALPLPDRARKRFDGIARKFGQSSERPPEGAAFPDYLRQQHAYADIWFADLIEWELDGDPHGVAASIAGDLRYPNGIRRRALVLLLTLAEAAGGRGDGEAAHLVEVAELLGELQSYAALSPLERLFAHPAPTVRRAAVRALRFLYFKRSFVIVRRALADRDAGVREAALVAISGLHFPHALGPLVGIYQASADGKVRAAALAAIGKIQSVEAGEFLVRVVRGESGELQDAAQAALAAIDNAEVLPIIRQHLEVEQNADVRARLGKLAARRGA